MSFYRKLVVRGDTWQYRIGKRYIGLKDPAGRRSQLLHVDVVEDPAEREYYIRNQNDDNVKLVVTPAMVKKWIEENAEPIG